MVRERSPKIGDGGVTHRATTAPEEPTRHSKTAPSASPRIAERHARSRKFRLSIAELTQNLGELATDLVESTVELGVQGVGFLINTLDQLAVRVDVGMLLAHLTLDLGLGHWIIVATTGLGGARSAAG